MGEREKEDAGNFVGFERVFLNSLGWAQNSQNLNFEFRRQQIVTSDLNTKRNKNGTSTLKPRWTWSWTEWGQK